MKSKKAKRQAKARRQAVSRSERVQATPETIAKLRPCPLKTMVHDGTMQPDQYEAALSIWDAHDALVSRMKAGTLDMQKVAQSHGEIGDRKDRLIAIYLLWGRELPRRFYLTSDIVVGWIDDHDERKRMTNDAQRRMLLKCCDLWIKVTSDHGRERRDDGA